MAAFIDSVSKFEKVFNFPRKTLRMSVDPEKGFNELRNSIKRAKVEETYNQVAQFYEALPKLPGSAVPVKSYKEMTEYIANNFVEKQVPNESVIRDLKVRCLKVMDDIFDDFYGR